MHIYVYIYIYLHLIQAAVLDENGLNSVFAEITTAKLTSNLKVDVQLAPMILNRCLPFYSNAMLLD